MQFELKHEIHRGLFVLFCIFAFSFAACTLTGKPNEPTAFTQPAPSLTVTAICDPSESRIVCEDRLTAQHITPPASPLLDAEFLTAEAAYQTQLALRSIVVEPPITTPTPSFIILSSQEDGLVRVRTRSSYQELPLFEVTFVGAIWRPEATIDGPVLIHTTIDGCELYLQAGGMGMTETPIITQLELAGYPVEAREFRQSRLLSYGFSADGGYYAFRLDMPQGVSTSDVGKCRTDGEMVIGTFRLMAN